MKVLIAINLLGFKGYGPLSYFLPIAAVLLLLFILSILWAVRDARRHELPALYAVLVLTLTGWPLSIIWWFGLRSTAKRLLRSAQWWHKAAIATVFVLCVSLLWGAVWRTDQLELAVTDTDSLVAAFNNRDATPVLRYLRLAAEAESPLAQMLLGFAYFDGMGLPQDHGEADVWFGKITEMGDAEFMYNLGRLYEEGDGVTRDYGEAMKWYRKAADQGYVEAMRNLGRYYASGVGVTQDDVEAVKWLRKAINLNPESKSDHKLLALILATSAYDDKVACPDLAALDDAIQAHKETIKLDADDIQSHWNLSQTYRWRGLFGLALSAANKALKLGGQMVVYQEHLAQIAFFQGDMNSALQEYSHITKTRPNDPGILHDIGMADFAMGNYQLMEQHFQRARELYRDKVTPSNEFYMLLKEYSALRQVGALKDATSKLDELVTTATTPWEKLLAKFHNGALSEKELILAAKTNCERCEAHFYVGYQQLINGDETSSQHSFRQAIDMQAFVYYEHALAAAMLSQMGSP